MHAERLGAVPLGNGRWRFELWAPEAGRVELQLLGDEGRLIPMARTADGYHRVVVDDLVAGTRYRYRFDDGTARPDPCSRLQAEGLDGASELVELDWPWAADAQWRGIPREDLVLYEIHVGTFSPKGDFIGLVPVLEALRRLGVTAIVLMPLAQCAHAGWGWDPIFPFAVEADLGGPDELRRLVEACHEIGLAVLVDVNPAHLAAAAPQLEAFGPYFDPERRTVFGPALNLDGPGSDEVRRFVAEATTHWVRDFHLDGVRIGSLSSLYDRSASPFVAELVHAVRLEGERLGRNVHVLATGEENDPRRVRSRDAGGLGFDAMHVDDVSLALQAQLYEAPAPGLLGDYDRVGLLARSLLQGFAYEGQHAPARRRRFGAPASVGGDRLIAAAQTHRHVARHGAGERLTARFGLGAARLAAAVILLSPRIPLLFMGEEYGEIAPFRPFEDPEGRDACRVQHARRREPGNAATRELYAELLELRRRFAPLRVAGTADVAPIVDEARRLLVFSRGMGADAVVVVHHFGPSRAELPVPIPPGRWRLRLDSADQRFGGEGSRVPNAIESTGLVTLSLGGWSSLLLETA